MNTGSICNKTVDVLDYLYSAQIDLLSITETWIKEKDYVTRGKLKLSGYHLDDIPKPYDRTGGRVGILHKCSLKSQ